jgi:hypothetical protein
MGLTETIVTLEAMADLHLVAISRHLAAAVLATGIVMAMLVLAAAAAVISVGQLVHAIMVVSKLVPAPQVLEHQADALMVMVLLGELVLAELLLFMRIHKDYQ